MRAATASIWTGLGVHLLLEAAGRWGAVPGVIPEGLPPAAAALLLSTGVLILVSAYSENGAARRSRGVAETGWPAADG